MVVIPFSFLPERQLKRFSPYFRGSADFFKKFVPLLEQDIIRAQIKFESEEYIAMCLVSTVFLFIFLTIT